jgi:DNA-binding NarL/FixJ family response regulator
MSQPSRILIVDDHPMVREGLVRLISQHQDLVCCGEAANGRDTVAAVASQRPDLVILDLRLKGEDGLELIKSLRSQFSDLRILILSQYEAPLYAERALRAGACGYLVKEQGAEEVLNAIRTVLGGELYLTRGIAALLLHKIVGANAKTATEHLQQLTDRELHVLNLLGMGLSTREIAAELGVSFKTVETHRENIKHKLGLQGAAALIHYATNWARQEAAIAPSASRTNSQA